MLEVRDINKTFQRSTGAIRAVADVSLQIAEGECYGLIGESGSGKSTLGAIIAGITAPDSGTVSLAGKQGVPGTSSALQKHQTQLQVIFQDPRASFDPRMTIGESLSQPLRYKLGIPHAQHAAAVAEALERVGLPAVFAERGINAVSVGQAQRVAIARALLARPKLIVCDEITSALDVSVQAEILALLPQLQRDLNLTLLFITHDIAVVAQVADRIGVMKSGEIVEEGDTETIIHAPKHPYTQALIQLART